MAVLLKKEVGVDPELVEGGRGEFTVWVGDQEVARKGLFGFPSEEEVLSAVRQAFATE